MEPAPHDVEVDRLAQQLSLLLRRSRSLMRSFAGQLHAGIDPSAYAVLLTVAESGPMRLVELADEFDLDKSTMSRQVGTLLRLDLLLRRPDPADGRAYLLELSPEGRRRLGEISERARRVWRERLSLWSTAEVATLSDGLARLRAELPGPADGGVTD